MTAKQAVATKTAAPLTLSKEDQAELDQWNTEESEIDASDILLPRLLLMQGLSELVTADEAKLGDIVNGMENSVLGGFNKSLTLVPVHVEKLWFCFNLVDGDKVFDKVMPFKENPNMPYETADSFNQTVLRIYFLDINDPTLPVVVNFKSTSMRAGKIIYNLMEVRNKLAKKNKAATMINLSSEKQQKDRHTYAVYKVEAAGETPVELQLQAMKWSKTIKAGETKVEAPKAEAPASTANY